MGCVVSSNPEEASTRPHCSNPRRQDVWPVDDLTKEEEEEAKLAEEFERAEAVVTKLADVLTNRAASGSLQDHYAINTQNIGADYVVRQSTGAAAQPHLFLPWEGPID